MENFFEKIITLINTIAAFLKKLFTWKEEDFVPASSMVDQYSKEHTDDANAK